MLLEHRLTMIPSDAPLTRMTLSGEEGHPSRAEMNSAMSLLILGSPSEWEYAPMYVTGAGCAGERGGVCG
jgi:hypothetical protein